MIGKCKKCGKFKHKYKEGIIPAMLCAQCWSLWSDFYDKNLKTRKMPSNVTWDYWINKPKGFIFR